MTKQDQNIPTTLKLYTNFRSKRYKRHPTNGKLVYSKTSLAYQRKTSTLSPISATAASNRM